MGADELGSLIGHVGQSGGSLLGGLIILVAVAITSLRRRRDTTIEELEKRVAALEQQVKDLKAEHASEVTELEQDRDLAHGRAETYKNESLQLRRDRYALRRVLADEGLTDPTSGSTVL